MTRYYNTTTGPLPVVLRDKSSACIPGKSWAEIPTELEGSEDLIKYVKKGFLRRSAVADVPKTVAVVRPALVVQDAPAAPPPPPVSVDPAVFGPRPKGGGKNKVSKINSSVVEVSPTMVDSKASESNSTNSDLVSKEDLPQ